MSDVKLIKAMRQHSGMSIQECKRIVMRKRLLEAVAVADDIASLKAILLEIITHTFPERPKQFHLTDEQLLEIYSDD